MLVCMNDEIARLNIDVPRPLMKVIKHSALSEGCTIRAWVERAIRAQLAREQHVRASQ